MSNKFLSIYPQLCSPKIGDKVVMEENYKCLWKKGDVGVIIKINNVSQYINNNHYLIDFDNCGNKEVYKSGRYIAWRNEFKLIRS